MKRLLWATMLSAALHAAVLWFAPGRYLQPPALSGSREPIEVSLDFVGAEKKAAPPAAARGRIAPAPKPPSEPPQPTAPMAKAAPDQKAPPKPRPRTPHPVTTATPPAAAAAPAREPQTSAAPAKASQSRPFPDGTPAESSTSAGNILKPAAPLYRRNPPPPYPRIAKARGYQGRTLLKVLVGQDGRVKEIAVASSSGYALLDEAAVNAVAKWLFEPARRGHTPVAMWVEVPIRFQIR